MPSDKEKRGLGQGDHVHHGAEAEAERDARVQEARRLFHALWGKASSEPFEGSMLDHYDKEEWAALQGLLSDLLGTAF